MKQTIVVVYFQCLWKLLLNQLSVKLISILKFERSISQCGFRTEDNDEAIHKDRTQSLSICIPVSLTEQWNFTSCNCLQHSHHKEMTPGRFGTQILHIIQIIKISLTIQDEKFKVPKVTLECLTFKRRSVQAVWHF